MTGGHLVGVIGWRSLASIPSPSSGTLSIGPLDLRAYGLMIALGIIAAVWLLGRRFEEKGIGTTDDASSIAIWGVAAGIIGARLYHVATDWHRFSDNLGAIPKIWEGGLGIPGGLLAGIAAGAWQAKRRGIPIAMMLTCAAPAIPLAQAIGRWGNWFNQELYGKPTDLPWALEIDDAHNGDFASGTTFHPTFLYESLWNFGLVFFLLWVDKHLRLGPGRLMAVYLMGYGTGRFWIEGLRIDPATDVGGMRWNQWVALAAILGGAIYLIATHGQKWPGGDVGLADDVDHVDGDGVAPDGDDVDGDGVAPDGDDVDVDGVAPDGDDVDVDGVAPDGDHVDSDSVAPDGDDVDVDGVDDGVADEVVDDGTARPPG